MTDESPVRLGGDYRRKKSEIRQDPELSWEQKEHRHRVDRCGARGGRRWPNRRVAGQKPGLPMSGFVRFSPFGYKVF